MQFDTAAELAALQAQTRRIRQVRYRPSRLDRYTGELLSLYQAGASAAELQRWLRARRIKVVLSTVTRWLEKMAKFASAARQAAGVIKPLQGNILRSVGTVRNYEQGLTRVAEWMKANRINHGDLRTLTPAQAITYLAARGAGWPENARYGTPGHPGHDDPRDADPPCRRTPAGGEIGAGTDPEQPGLQPGPGSPDCRSTTARQRSGHRDCPGRRITRP